MPKTIFVLGGTGLAGSIAIDLFLSRSHTVVAYSRNASKFRPDLATTHPSTFFPIAGTLESEEDICAAMGSRKVDAVVSFLGPVRADGARCRVNLGRVPERRERHEEDGGQEDFRTGNDLIRRRCRRILAVEQHQRWTDIIDRTSRQGRVCCDWQALQRGRSVQGS